MREAVRSTYPWVDLTDRGPRSVEAGECDRCGAEPRLLATCGPVSWTALCRSCALELGHVAWCEGHADVAAGLLAWARGLPAEWPTVCRVWWVATGEVRLAHLGTAAAARLGPDVAAALGTGE